MGLDGMVDVFASCLKKKELTCMLLPTLHLYINFSSSCKDLNYEPPPWTGMQANKTSFKSLKPHLTRPCCHPLSVGWRAEEEDGKGPWCSGFEQGSYFLELLPRRFHYWQLSGKSEKMWQVMKHDVWVQPPPQALCQRAHRWQCWVVPSSCQALWRELQIASLGFLHCPSSGGWRQCLTRSLQRGRRWGCASGWTWSGGTLGTWISVSRRLHS